MQMYILICVYIYIYTYTNVYTYIHMKVITLKLAYWERHRIDSPVAHQTVIQLYISSFCL